MTNDVHMIEVVFDGGWRSNVGLLPWLSTLIVPGIVIRSLFLLAHRKSERAMRSARRCFLGIHAQSVFALISGAWISLSAWLPLRREFVPGAAYLAIQSLNMSQMLWLVAYQCFIATIGALVVMACSGVRPCLWQPRIAVISICLCAVAQAITLGLFGIMRN